MDAAANYREREKAKDRATLDRLVRGSGVRREFGSPAEMGTLEIERLCRVLATAVEDIRKLKKENQGVR